MKPLPSFTITGNLIHLFQRRIFPASIEVRDGRIFSITESDEPQDQYILPGFVDAHVHIESSMLVPTEFARLAVVHGTVATVSDPHEIANVCGREGVDFMIANSKQTPFKIFFGAPSCVPATDFETAGANLNAEDIKELMADKNIWYLSEMMNYPGVLNKDPEVLKKIAEAQRVKKPIDGHAPGLMGEDVIEYAAAGITTDHESFRLEEALHKVKYGMYCLIREGSAAKNFDALIDIIRSHPYSVMFCSDDKHPDELVLHHINALVKRALKKGYDLFDVLRAASLHPVVHYDLPVGLLRVNDPADFIVADNVTDFNILQTYINGDLVAENGKSLLPHIPVLPINNFKAVPIMVIALAVPAREGGQIKVIEALEGQLITNAVVTEARVGSGFIVSDTTADILKLVVINRYTPNAPPAVAFIRHFGLKKGAIASTVAHDCHNIIAVGVDDESIAAAINALVDAKGGISVAEDGTSIDIMPLPVAGLMSLNDGYAVAEEYSRLDKKAKELGTALKAPFMTLSFMALLVIPSLKLSDRGLFDGKEFAFTSVYA
jgi:adenine deaminase